MSKFNAVTGLTALPSIALDICHPCSISKSQHRPLKTPSRNLVRQPGDVVLADLIGPLLEGVGTAKYALLIQDSFSSLTAVVPLRNKSEAKSQLKAWILRFNNSTDYHVKCLQTNNGLEFKNDFLDAFTSANGIVREYLIRYEHHQNGQIELTNRTIGEMAQKCLLEANLLAHLWPYAFKHAVWIFNRVLHLRDTKTPYELVSGLKPSLLPLRTFGAKGFIYDLLFWKYLTARAIVGYNLGITPDSKGWAFWLPEKNSII
ncbi:hypothetical protein O181_129318 [Austropuccinia psidii MF-1]|uniref:Integrase catalytic domain-containing protein n=1 Tax=Austropuccinia psidii MF-1 TaxID=1389203 RepID=A0A9Q3KWJ8_9BASI|nr:hypothetical protein [Austropuccinia psidii MF-1]